MNGSDWHWLVWLPWEKKVWTLTIVVSVILVFFVATHASPPARSGCLVTSTRSVSCPAKATSP
jgi:hypothetical protein